MKKGRKIDAMHRFFGIGDGYCKGCIHLIDQPGCYKKCKVYGNTGSEAKDWAQKWPACGLKDKPYNGDRAIIEVIMHEKKKAQNSQIDGQMTLEL